MTKMIDRGRREVPGFPGYLIDSDGNLWSRRLGRNHLGGLSPTYRPMNPSKMRHGHRFVRLCRGDGRHYKRYVHRLVLESFVGQCPDGMECRHLDGNPANNRLSNLKWGTKVENESDKRRHGTSNVGPRNGQAKLNVDQVAEIRRRYAVGGVTQLALAREFGVSDGTICNIIQGKRYPTFQAKVPEAANE